MEDMGHLLVEEAATGAAKPMILVAPSTPYRNVIFAARIAAAALGRKNDNRWGKQ
tara:strand:+ start:259 stop:423 length:165 start_codon:yes stop_codon:yes gene_type:complete